MLSPLRSIKLEVRTRSLVEGSQEATLIFVLLFIKVTVTSIRGQTDLKNQKTQNSYILQNVVIEVLSAAELPFSIVHDHKGSIGVKIGHFWVS